MQGHDEFERGEKRQESGTRPKPLRPGTTGPQVYAGARHRAGTGAERLRLSRGWPLRWARGWLSTQRLWHTLLPSACALCGVVQAEVVCAGCADDLLATVARCPQCALRTPRGRPCDACLAAPTPIDAACTVGDYAAPQDQLVLALKAGAALPLARWFAEALAARVAGSAMALPDLLVPVPLSPQRLATRGFNQAWEIARPLARLLGVAADATLLARRRDTVSQRVLDLAARQANLHGALTMTRTTTLAGRHVGIVDDVMTTGATLREAALVLKAHGAARVTVLPALRTP